MEDKELMQMEAQQEAAQAVTEAAAPAADMPVVPAQPAAPVAEAAPAAEAAQPAAEEGVLSHTAALEQELEQLRQEKHRRQLLDEATVQLSERGIDPAFAPFVLGENSAATRKKVEQFDHQFANALRRHLAARLPDREPRDFAVSRPAPRRRGIRTLG